MAITKPENYEGLSENPTAVEVVAFMKASQSDDDWNKRCKEVKSKFGGDYPDFWYQEIVLGGIKPKNSQYVHDIKITSLDLKKNLQPIEDLGKKEDVEGDIVDLQQITLYNRPTQIPSLKEGYKFICGYDRGLGEQFFVCNTLEGAQELYDKYAQGRALRIHRYTGKIE